MGSWPIIWGQLEVILTNHPTATTCDLGCLRRVTGFESQLSKGDQIWYGWMNEVWNPVYFKWNRCEIQDYRSIGEHAEDPFNMWCSEDVAQFHHLLDASFVPWQTLIFVKTLSPINKWLLPGKLPVEKQETPTHKMGQKEELRFLTVWHLGSQQ